MRKGWRVKPREATWHYITIRAVGYDDDRLFGDREREKLREILMAHCVYFTVEIAAYNMTNNEMQIVLNDPAPDIPDEEVCLRYARYYPERPNVLPGTPECDAVRAKITDMSNFMRAILPTFTRWYNETRPYKRWGKLWITPFKSSVMEEGMVLPEGLIYL